MPSSPLQMDQIRTEVEGWSTPWRKLFLAMAEDLDGTGSKEDIARTCFRVLSLRRVGKKKGWTWNEGQDGWWSWGPKE